MAADRAPTSLPAIAIVSSIAIIPTIEVRPIGVRSLELVGVGRSLPSRLDGRGVPLEERRAVEVAGADRTQKRLQAGSRLVAQLVVTVPTEVLELLLAAVPPIALLVVLAGL